MASSWFLAVDGIDGDSVVEGHEGELEVGSWSWGVSSTPGRGGGGGAGRPVIEDLVLSLASDTGALRLLRSCVLGVRADTATLTGARGGESRFDFLAYAMEDVNVTAVTEATSDDGDVRYQLSLRFARLTATVTPQNPDGSAGTPVSVEVGNRGF